MHCPNRILSVSHYTSSSPLLFSHKWAMAAFSTESFLWDWSTWFKSGNLEWYLKFSTGSDLMPLCCQHDRVEGEEMCTSVWKTFNVDVTCYTVLNFWVLKSYEKQNWERKMWKNITSPHLTIHGEWWPLDVNTCYCIILWYKYLHVRHRGRMTSRWKSGSCCQKRMWISVPLQISSFLFNLYCRVPE